MLVVVLRLERILNLLTQIHVREGRRLRVELRSSSQHHLIQVDSHVVRWEHTIISVVQLRLRSSCHITVRNDARDLHLLFFFRFWLFLVGVNEFDLTEGPSVAHIGTGKRTVLILLGVQSLRGEIWERKSIQFDSVAVLGTKRALLFFLRWERVVLERTTPQG